MDCVRYIRADAPILALGLSRFFLFFLQKPLSSYTYTLSLSLSFSVEQPAESNVSSLFAVSSLAQGVNWSIKDDAGA